MLMAKNSHTRNITRPCRYIIDLIDLEMAPPPLPRPAGSLSILDYGAKGGGLVDDRAAIQAALDAAGAKGVAMWIPVGDFGVSGDDAHVETFNVPGNVAVIGAGMWYSNLLGT